MLVAWISIFWLWHHTKFCKMLHFGDLDKGYSGSLRINSYSFMGIYVTLKEKSLVFKKMRVMLKSFHSGCTRLQWLVSASHCCHYSVAHRLYFKILQIFQRGWGIKSNQNHLPFKNWREVNSSSSSKYREHHSPVVAWHGNHVLTDCFPRQGAILASEGVNRMQH